MHGTIPISVDHRRFDIPTWLGFFALSGFLTLHFAFMQAAWLSAIWDTVWTGDFTGSDLSWAIGLTIMAVPGLTAFYAMFYLGLKDDGGFNRGHVLLDTSAARLILCRRHLLGFTVEKSFALAEIEDIKITWTTDEDGTDTPHLDLIAKGRPVRLSISRPADAADLPAFAERLRAELTSAGWSAPSRSSVSQP